VRRFCLVLSLALVLGQPVIAASDPERLEVYHQFRSLFDAHRFQEALAPAQQLVTLTEQQYGPKAAELVTPLTNLGTTYHRLGRHEEAVGVYQRSIEIVEATASGTDRRLLRPLQGLGVTYAALGQFDNASLVLKRAVDLSRNIDGLFNAGQLQMLTPLIASYVALADFANAEKEHQFALQVAETAYGKDDLRLLGPIDTYARWFEFVGRYSAARALHARALSIVESNGKLTPLAVDALRGIARTYRLEYFNGSESEPATADAPLALEPLSSPSWSMRSLNPDGEQALRAAVQVLARETPPNHARLGETLVDLADWYVCSGDEPRAQIAYRQAWLELQTAGSTGLLAQPRQLAYRPPPASITRSRIEPREAEEHGVDVSFTVTPEGRTAEVTAVQSDASEGQQKAVISAVKRARYGPRVLDGSAVATPGVTLHERIVTKRKKPS